MKAQLPPKIGIHSQNYCSTLNKARVGNGTNTFLRHYHGASSKILSFVITGTSIARTILVAQIWRRKKFLRTVFTIKQHREQHNVEFLSSATEEFIGKTEI